MISVRLKFVTSEWLGVLINQVRMKNCFLCIDKVEIFLWQEKVDFRMMLAQRMCRKLKIRHKIKKVKKKKIIIYLLIFNRDGIVLLK